MRLSMMLFVVKIGACPIFIIKFVDDPWGCMCMPYGAAGHMCDNVIRFSSLQLQAHN